MLLADLAFASGNDGEALARYTALLQRRPHDSAMLEHAAIVALRRGDVTQATQLADRAIASASPTWRGWNARGVAADLARDGVAADMYYSRALAVAADQPEVLNNLGWSRLLRGDWASAIEPLEQAAALQPNVPRISNNLELARAGVTDSLPRRQPGETNEVWAARLNDAGVVARLRGDRKRAIAAFTHALEARASWYNRAASNLQSAETQE